MSDYTEIQASQSVKLAGANPSTGIEDNYLEVDVNGYIGVRLYDSGGTAIDTNYGAISSHTIRTASQIGNATGAALFGAGTTSAQVLRVVLPTDQTAIPATQSGTWNIGTLSSITNPVAVTQSGTWSTGRTWTLASGTDSVAAVQSGTWTVQPGNTANTTAWLVKDNSLGTVAAGTAGTQSSLAGGVFNTALPTLTTGQQAALQLDSSGRLIISPPTVTAAEDKNYGSVGANTLRVASQLGNATGAADFNYGSVGAQTLRTASQLGNATGAALFGAGTTTAQVLRVVLPTDQTAIPASQSGTWTVQQGTPPWTVQGTSASGASKSGNPVQIGGVFNTTQPTVTTGQTVESQFTSRGAQIVATGTDPFKTNLQDGSGTPITSTLVTGKQGLDVNVTNPITATVSPLPAAGSGFSFGQINTNTSVAYLAVESTAYTEPTSNSAMTIVSASASDASAGTGARTVTVTYLDSTGAGPFTTTFTMNGTTAVTAGVSNMCFVEKIVVATIGSTGSNVGILTLKTGGGATVGTVAATTNQTFWAHHYVPTGKTCYVSGFSFGNNATASGNGAQFILKSDNPTAANTPEIQVSDVLAQAGVSSTTTRSYISPIQIAGPARIRAYVLPYANAATTQFASFDFIDN